MTLNINSRSLLMDQKMTQMLALRSLSSMRTEKYISVNIELEYCVQFFNQSCWPSESLKWLNNIFGTNSNNISVISESQSICDITVCDKKVIILSDSELYFSSKTVK